MNHRVSGRNFLIFFLVFSFLIFPVYPNYAQPQQKSIDGLLTLSSAEFYRQSNQLVSQCLWQECSQSVHEFWQLLDHLEKQTDKDASTDSLLATQYLAEAILKFGGREDYQKLLTFYDTIPTDSMRQAVLLEALSTYWIKEELAKIFQEKKPAGIKFPKVELDVPAQMNNLPAELQNAWVTYKEITFAHQKRLQPYTKKGWIDTQNSWPFFNSVIADFLHEKQGNTIGKMAPFEWGGWCGTGSLMLFVPKTRTIWMAYLKERDYSAALGAMLAFMGQGAGMMVRNDDNFLLEKQFIDWCGFNWEDLLIGALLDGHPEYLRLLGVYGSARTAQLLNEMRSLPMEEWNRESYVRAVAAFITPGCTVSNYGTSSSADITRQSKDEISSELQRELLDIVTSEINPATDNRMMDIVSHLLTPLCRPEAKEALRAILHSPYVEPRKRAVIALQALGEIVPAPVDPGPVYVRLLVDDIPFADRDVAWTLKQDNQMQVSSTAPYGCPRRI